jgi:FimV-like protein
VKQMITGGLRPFVALLTLLLWGFGGLAASALELGAGRLLSAPGAPLEVEIPLLQVGEGELEVLKPQLPANSRSAELADAKVELAKSSDGAAVLRVRSGAPLSADSVRFVVVADWGRGRRFREYAFSLVAGAEAAAAAAASAAPPAASPAAPTADPLPSVTTLSTSGARGIETEPMPAAKTDAAPVSRVVRPGETLMSISREWSAKTGTTLAQTMVGIYRANPQAFGPGGMNELLVNARLALPGAADLGATPASAASTEISRELEIWRTGGATPPTSAAALSPSASKLPATPTLPATPKLSATPKLPSTPELPATMAPVEAAPPVVAETPEIKVSKLETALSEKSAALAAADAEAAALKARITALEAAASTVKEKQTLGWLAKAREWAALAWWAIPALLLAVLILLLALVLKGRNKTMARVAETAESSAVSTVPRDVEAVSAPREMSFELPPIKPNRAEPVVTKAPVTVAAAAEESSIASDLEGDPPPIDEAGSKIDLARAFIEMGHHDAAILELQAALRIGDETQRAEAIRLLDSLPKS